MEIQREFFQRVRKTVMPRPAYREDVDIMGQAGTAWVTQAEIYGDNWYLDWSQGLLEIYNAGAAICFKNALPRKDKYKKEGLYLRLGIAYRTTENAQVNIRTFSGNHVSLPNAIHGSIYYDPFNYWYVTDDLTININTIHANEKLWLQRVDWEWVSKEIIYEDELQHQDHYFNRKREDVQPLYTETETTDEKVKDFLMKRIKEDEHFAKRCLALLKADRLLAEDLVSLYKSINGNGS